MPRQNDVSVGVPDALVLTPAGVIPAGAVRTGTPLHGNSESVPYQNWTGSEYELPYNERAVCAGQTKAHKSCQAKAEPGEAFCKSHLDQGR